jgi:hypothetical protein
MKERKKKRKKIVIYFIMNKYGTQKGRMLLKSDVETIFLLI